MKKYIIIGSCAILLLALGAGIGGKFWISHHFTAKNIAAISQEYLGAPIKIKSDPVFELFPLSITAHDIAWQSAAFSIDAKSCKITLDLFAFITGKLEIAEAIIENPKVILKEFSNSYESGPSLTNDFRSQQRSYQIERLVINDGNFSLEGEQDEINLSSIHLTAENIGEKQEADLKCDFTLTINSKIDNFNPQLAGNTAFKTKVRYYSPNLTFRQAGFTFTSTRNDMLEIFSPIQIVFDGAIDLFNGNFRINPANLALPQGEIKTSGEGNFIRREFKGSSYIETALSKIFAADKKINNSINAETDIYLNRDTALLGNLTLEGDGVKGNGKITASFPSASKPVSISGQLDFDNINLNNLLKFSKDYQQAQQKDLNFSSMQNHSGPVTAGLNLDLACNIETLIYEKSRFDKVVYNIKGEDGKYLLNGLTANWGRGVVTGDGVFNLYSMETDLHLGAEKVDLGRILGEWGIEGIIGGETNAKLNLHGIISPDILSTISGNGRLECHGAKIHVLTEIAHMLPIPGGKKFVFPDTVDKLSAAFAGDRGIFIFKPIDLAAGSLTAIGMATADLPRNMLDGTASFKILDINLPVIFKGPLDDVSWHLGEGFFKELKKLIP